MTLTWFITQCHLFIRLFVCLFIQCLLFSMALVEEMALVCLL